MPESNGKSGGNGWKPFQLLLLGGLGLGGAGTIGVGFEVNSARITATEQWLERLQAHTLAQDAALTALRHELSEQLEIIRSDMVPRDFRMETVHQFEKRVDRIQQELNTVRDRIGPDRSGPDER